MPKSIWNPGKKVTSAFLNALQNIIFDDLDLDGHYSRLTDDALTSLPGNIKPQWQSFRDEFKVSAETGLVAAVTGGVAILESGLPVGLGAGTIACIPSATSYVAISASGTIINSLTAPVHGLLLARVTCSAAAIAQVEDLRSRFRVMPRGNAIRTFGGGGQDGDYVLSSGVATLSSGEYYFKSFTIAAGATLNTKGALKIYCSGDVTISGTLINAPSVAGGGAMAGAGWELNKMFNSPSAGKGFGGASDVNIGSDDAYSYTSSTLGSGGAGAIFSLSAQPTNFTPVGWFYSTRGGKGGSSFELESAGRITIAGAIEVPGGNGPDSPSGFSGWSSGGGGGSGGLIHLKSLTAIIVQPSALLSTKGGNGGIGFRSDGNPIARGGGGGGGWIVLNAPSVQTSGATLNVSGGLSAPLQPNSLGSVAGGSYAGVGGAYAQPGSVGSVVIRIGDPL